MNLDTIKVDFKGDQVFCQDGQVPMGELKADGKTYKFGLYNGQIAEGNGDVEEAQAATQKLVNDWFEGEMNSFKIEEVDGGYLVHTSSRDVTLKIDGDQITYVFEPAFEFTAADGNIANMIDDYINGYSHSDFIPFMFIRQFTDENELKKLKDSLGK